MIKKFISKINWADSIATILALALFALIGSIFGLKYGVEFGQRNVTEVRNEILDIKPYDASYKISDLEYFDITTSGCTIRFNGESEKEPLSVEYTIYPSDMFISENVIWLENNQYSYEANIKTYPEGGTLAFRILKGDLMKDNKVSLWYYINLPRGSDNNVLPPPYLNLDSFQLD